MRLVKIVLGAKEPQPKVTNASILYRNMLLLYFSEMYNGKVDSLPAADVRNKKPKMSCDDCTEDGDQTATSYCDDCRKRLCYTHMEVHIIYNILYL